MKLRNYFFGALACLALASCSSDDDAVDSGQENTGKYIAVNIVNSSATRGTAGGYEAGIADPDENQVNSVVLVFYNNDTFLSASNATIHSGWTEGDHTPNVESIATATAYAIPNDTKGEPNRVVAILNAPDVSGTPFTDHLNAQKPTFTQLKNYNGVYDGVTSGNFVMSNSVWDGNLGYTEVSRSDFKLSASEAQTAPVDIYVERVIAKVEMSFESDFKTQSSPLYLNGNSTITQIIPIPVSFNLSRTADDSYLIKNLPTIDGKWDQGWSSQWNDPTNKRSYWAESHATTFDYYKYSANSDKSITYTKGIGTTDDGVITLPLTIESDATFYCQENTEQSNATYALLTTQLYTIDESYNLTEYSGDLIKWYGSYYSTEANYLNAIKTEIDKKFSCSSEYTLKLVRKNKYSSYAATAKQWEVVANVVEDIEFTLKSDNTKKLTSAQLDDVLCCGNATEFTDLNILNSTAKMWGNGRGYFYTEIEHFGPAKYAEYGVVRNHVYKLAFGSMKGLGSPVYDPDPNYDPTDPDDPDPTDPGSDQTEEPEPEEEEEIVPDRPTDETSYLSAKINILKWKIVNQGGIDLQ